MKKMLALISALLAAVMLCSACSGGDMPADVKPEDIYGIWEYTDAAGGTITFRFNKNSLYVRTDSTGSEEVRTKGYYTVTDNKVVMFTDEGKEPIDREIKQLDDKTMKWHDPVYGDMEFEFIGEAQE